MSFTYGDILERLEGIESDLAERQEEFEQAAKDHFRTLRDYELRVARVKLTTKADTETAKKDKALDSIAAADDDLYERYTDAEARYQSLKAAVSVLEKRSIIGMALLKSQTRESGPSPQWSGAAAS